MDFEYSQIGRRVREVRKWRGMNLEATAGLAGLSAGYLSRIERGQRAVTKRSVLESLARALRVSPAELAGTPYPPSSETPTESHSAMATLADLLGGWWVGEVPDAPGRPLHEVLAELRAFYAARNSSGPRAAGDYPTQVAVLSPLIRDLLAASADPKDGRQALAPLLTAYHVAGSIASRLGIPGMPSLAADRMKQVADALDDPTWTAVADWGRAHFLSGTNRDRQYDLAVIVADETPPERPETRGMANLTAALAAAAQGRPDMAETHLAEAAALAELVEPDVSPWPSGVMQFGRTNVGIFRVTIGVELGQGARVAEFASTVRTESISRGRQASFWMEYGRGLLAERKTRDQGLSALVRAEQLAPQQVHNNVFAREAVTSLLTSARREAGGRELRGLAWRMGIAPAA
ncbi:MAG TPA: helix-turn-helix transcriptional regulator [Kribbella sp.]|jgi:transcriptional regulator with XRE-family HTH domain